MVDSTNLPKVDINQIATDLNNKMDRDGVNAIASVCVESWHDENGSWYRIYSDGWCEQGGSGNYNNGGAIVFAKTFVNTNYSIQVSPRGVPTNATSDNNWLAFPLTKSTNQCTVRLIDSDGAEGRNGAIEWFVCGFTR